MLLKIKYRYFNALIMPAQTFFPGLPLLKIISYKHLHTYDNEELGNGGTAVLFCVVQ